MSEMEIYFARENALWNLSTIICFIFLIPVIYVIGAMIIEIIKEIIKEKWKNRKE